MKSKKGSSIINVWSTTKIKNDPIVKRVAKDPKKRKQMGHIILQETEQFVPMDTGRLTKSGQAFPTGIKYGAFAPYAKIVWSGKRKGKPIHFQTTHHADATAKWTDVGYKKKQDKILKRVEKEVLGGK